MVKSDNEKVSDLFSSLDSEKLAKFGDSFNRSWNHFQLLENKDLIILKGHLLVEERLWEMVSLNLKNPKEVDRFSFSQFLSLAKAMYDLPEDTPWLWAAIGKLNKLRNMAAHNLSPDDLLKLESEFLKVIPQDLLADSSNQLKDGISAVFSTCLWFVLFD